MKQKNFILFAGGMSFIPERQCCIYMRMIVSGRSHLRRRHLISGKVCLIPYFKLANVDTCDHGDFR